MKIKCPVKKCKRIVNHDGELKHHIVSEHSMDDVAETLVSQTFKIHEKIEERENQKDGGEFIQVWIANESIQDLKSLLENER